jgi:hypothetical protein
MLIADDINKISINSGLKIENVNVTTLLFNAGKATSKTRYSIDNHFINMVDPSNDYIALYENIDSSHYYEYYVTLQENDTKIKGYDRFNSFLKLGNETILVFVNGYKLIPEEFEVNREDNSITIIPNYPKNQLNTVIIYTSPNIVYQGKVTNDISWNSKKNQFILNDYNYLRYAFFKNGELIDRRKISKDANRISLNIPIDDTLDIVEYYRLPNDTCCLQFTSEPGQFTFGPRDIDDQLIPNVYNAIAIFDDTVRILIDNVRTGYFIREENSDGALIIVDSDFEKTSVQCMRVANFNKTILSPNEYYLQVAEATSILKYISQFDLNGTMFKELLNIFQRTLLDETYDSIKRLGDIRDINRVDSSNISKLIKLLGMDVNTTNMSLKQKHNLLEELRSFYNIVGTKASLNFYNAINPELRRIVEIDQLFTPIKDGLDGNKNNKRYVTFRTAEELGGKKESKYVTPETDYGYIDALAEGQVSLNNSPRSSGILENENGKPVFVSPRQAYIINDQGEFIKKDIPLPLNKYIEQPKVGPNKPNIDYGYITQSPVSFIDYGKVDEKIIGHWEQWTNFDRPEGWYPTNHVEIALETPADEEYEVFIKEFTKAFYDLASTVLYIHDIVQVYTFGSENKTQVFDNTEKSYHQMNILTTQIYDKQCYTFTNDPNRQAGAYKPINPIKSVVRNAKLTMENDGYIKASLEVKTTFDDGTEWVEDAMEKRFKCSLFSTTDWEVEQNSNASETQNLQIKKGNITTESDKQWSVKFREYAVSTDVILEETAALNKWTAILPEQITFKEGDLIYNFNTINWKFEDLGSETTETENERVYTYEDTLKVTATNVKGDGYVVDSAPGTIITREDITIRDIDYLVLKYIWKKGRDLDTETKIINAYSSRLINASVGYGRGSQVPSNVSIDDCIFNYTGDNTGTASEERPQEENILINITNLKTLYNSELPELIEIALSGTWFSQAGGQPELEIVAYKGGTMIKNGYAFENSGGQLKFKQNAKVKNMSNNLHQYNLLGILYINKNTKDAFLTIQEPIGELNTLTTRVDANVTIEVKDYNNNITTVIGKEGFEEKEFELPVGSEVTITANKSGRRGTIKLIMDADIVMEFFGDKAKINIPGQNDINIDDYLHNEGEIIDTPIVIRPSPGGQITPPEIEGLYKFTAIAKYGSRVEEDALIYINEYPYRQTVVHYVIPNTSLSCYASLSGYISEENTYSIVRNNQVLEIPLYLECFVEIDNTATNPSSMKVYIDDVLIENPSTYTTFVKSGTILKIRCEADGYETYEETRTINQDTVIRIPSLQRQVKTTFVIKNENDEILQDVDAKFVSEGKIEINGLVVTSEEYIEIEYTFQKDSYITTTGKITVRNVDRTYNIVMKTASKLQIETYPSDAKIIIDNETYRNKEVIIKPKGTIVNIVIEREGYESKTIYDYEFINDFDSMLVELIKNITVNFSIIPEHAAVIINGERYGNSRPLYLKEAGEITYDISGITYGGSSFPKTIYIDTDTVISEELYGLTLNNIPADSITTINGKDFNNGSIIYFDKDTTVQYEVSKDRYVSKSGEITMDSDKTLQEELTRYVSVSFEITPDTAPAILKINGVQQSTFENIQVEYGTSIEYGVSADWYGTKTGTIETVINDMTIPIRLERIWDIYVDAIPEDASITINDEPVANKEHKRFENGTRVNIKVEKEGYETYEREWVINTNMSINVTLRKLYDLTFTLDESQLDLSDQLIVKVNDEEIDWSVPYPMVEGQTYSYEVSTSSNNYSSITGMVENASQDENVNIILYLKQGVEEYYKDYVISLDEENKQVVLTQYIGSDTDVVIPNPFEE